MKKLPLSIQIWALCTGVTLCIFGLIMLFMPHMLNGFFTREVYALLEQSQKSARMITLTVTEASVPSEPIGAEKIQDPNNQDAVRGTVSVTLPETKPKTAKTDSDSPAAKGSASSAAAIPADTVDLAYSAGTTDNYDRIIMVQTGTIQGTAAVVPAIQILPAAPADNSSGLPPVNHLLVNDLQKLNQTLDLPTAFIKDIQQQAGSQKQTLQRYAHREGSQTLLYVISKQDVLGKAGYFLTYAWGSYTRELSSSLMQQLLWLMIALCLVSGIPSFFLARYLTRPLVEMEKAAHRISERNWQGELGSDRRDEIGRLARSFNKMRMQLAAQDEGQQSFLQNLSHELKTPAMVISSYAQAIQDGIYPRGSLEESVRVIQDESGRLQKRVQDFLYLNKLKYLALHRIEDESFDLGSLIGETVERLRWQRPDLKWELELGETVIKGDRSQWAIAMENLLDNQLRYAKNRVEISLGRGEQTQPERALLRVFNDGPPIEADLLEHIFDPYASGKKGQFGLGLAIFRQVMDIHQAAVSACNEESGAAFYIEPLLRFRST